MSGDPELYFAEDGTPRSARFGDIYYSPQDGLAESRAVFLAGCHLADSWQRGGTRDFTLLELGFGTGLNVAAAMQMWAASGCAGHLHIFTVEAFVMTRDQAAQALANWPEIAQFAQALTAQWPQARHGFHPMDFPQWRVSVTVALMPVREALAAWGGRADAVFLDGFSPALNPDMWADDVFGLVAGHCRPGARLGTFTVAGFVRRGLQAAGFAVAKCPGYGRKRERLEGVLAGEAMGGRPVQRVAIIGAGIAGASVAWQARRLGLDVTVFDPEPGSGASGNAAALVTPRLDAGDNAISALFADAFSYAVGLYGRLCPEAILGRGVVQCAASERDNLRLAKIAGQAGFSRGDIVRFGPGEQADAPTAQGIGLETALWVKPEAILAAMLAAVPVRGERVRAVSRGRVVTDDGVHDGFDAVIVACGQGIFDISGYVEMDLRPVRGQLEVAERAVELRSAVAFGGYALPLGYGVLFGSTHDRDDRGRDVREESRAANLASLTGGLPQVAAQIDGAPTVSRASIRVTTRDYLPAVGEVAPGVHVMTGLGARGFCLAPLLARAVLADILDAGQPLPVAVKALLRPGRLIRP